MSVAGGYGSGGGTVPLVWSWGIRSSRIGVWSLPPMDRQTPVKTLPSRNFAVEF